MALISWVKLSVDQFDNHKMILLESENLKERDVTIAIFFKLITMAARLNGLVAFNEDTPYTLQKLSLLLKRSQKQVKKAIDLLDCYDLIEVDEQFFIKIFDWEEEQFIEGIEKQRASSRERVRKFRERKKNALCNVTEDVTVTIGNTSDINKNREEKKKDDDEDLKADKNKQKEERELSKYKNKLQKLDNIKDQISSDRYAELKRLLEGTKYKEFDNGLIQELESLGQRAA